MTAAKLLSIAHDAGVRIRLGAHGQLRLAYRRDTDPALLDRLRAHKPAIVEHLLTEDMPAGVGVCPGCDEVRWLRAGPTTTVCDECEITRLLNAGVRAVEPLGAAVQNKISNQGTAS